MPGPTFSNQRPFPERPFGFDALYHWNFNFELAGVRNRESLARLPEPERKNWQTFWADYIRVREDHKIKP